MGDHLSIILTIGPRENSDDALFCRTLVRMHTDQSDSTKFSGQMGKLVQDIR